MAHTALERWFRSQPGAFLHPQMHIRYSDEHGYHWQSEQDIEANTRLLTIPHSLSLSYLNALVDDAYGVFQSRRHDFTVEAIGFFYLALQYLNPSESFWKPYLDTLPSPSDMHTTPLWFDDVEDEIWLRDTDVAHTMAQRKAVYRSYYDSGIKILAEAGTDISQLSWDLFRWAITMFTSRSFPSRSIAPHDSKYWIAYKTGALGRQAVVLDMQRTPAADLDFSVLFPVMDAGNHDPNVKVHWDFDPGRFSLTATQRTSAGEVFNNYGPKANDELLQGYGFCIANNPYDVVLMTLKQPSTDLQTHLRITHSGYFDRSGAWQSDKATFRLGRLPAELATGQLLDHLPATLKDLLLHIVRHDLGFPSATQDDDHQQLLAGWHNPHVIRILLSSMAAKLAKLHATKPQFIPGRARHVYSSIYRQSQIEMSSVYVRAFQAYLQSLMLEDPSQRKQGPDLVSLPVALQCTLPSTVDDFLKGVEVSANTSDVPSLIAAGWEEDLWVLFLAFTHLLPQQNGSTFPWTEQTLAHVHSQMPDTGLVAQAESLMDIVQNAAQVHRQSAWASAEWSAEMIARTGGAYFRDMSFVIPTRHTPNSSRSTDAALAVCL